MARKNAEEKQTDFAQLKSMNSAADFYGWKELIVTALEPKDAEYAAQLGRNNSVLEFFLKKEEILAKLGVD